jgi:hypothetical protein
MNVQTGGEHVLKEESIQSKRMVYVVNTDIAYAILADILTAMYISATHLMFLTRCLQLYNKSFRKRMLSQFLLMAQEFGEY